MTYIMLRFRRVIRSLLVNRALLVSTSIKVEFIQQRLSKHQKTKGCMVVYVSEISIY
nr:MAG TPA: hypothetical protein [Caudoviricetes sp.]